MQQTVERECWINCRLGRLALEPSLVHRTNVTLAEDDSPLDYILELADVAGPTISSETIERFVVDCSELLASDSPETRNEVLDQ